MKYRVYVMITHENSKLKLNDVAIVSKALLEAARRLQLTNAELAQVVGISESKLSRMSKENAVVSKSGKEFDLAVRDHIGAVSFVWVIFLLITGNEDNRPPLLPVYVEQV